MIMPLWQKPHCGTSSAAQAFCTGCEPSLDRPSMVTIFWFGFSAASGSTQERTGAPSMCTVQAPHCAMPQPYLVPVRPELLAQHPQQRRVGLGFEPSPTCR